MGRAEKSQGLAPPAVRKEMRAKQARHVVNKVVPALLASNARARRGVEGSELIVDPGPGIGAAGGVAGKNKSKSKEGGGDDVGYVKRKGQGRRKVKEGEGGEEEDGIAMGDGEREGKGRGKASKAKKRNDSLDAGLLGQDLNITAPAPLQSPKKERCIRIITTDTLTAAHMLSHTTPPPSAKPSSNRKQQQQNTCILNMASPLRPGGGVFAGATSQEEFLCARTTLLPSLKEEYYRLPEHGAIFTRDVLVFRNALSLGDSQGELPHADRWYVDVISAGMLRFPELEGDEDAGEKRLCKKDREMVERKIRAVLRIAEHKGARKLVLGAWGCGAYGNPVRDVAEAFRRVLDGTTAAAAAASRKSKGVVLETWAGLEHVVFAIANPKMAREFAQAFGGGIQVEDGPGGAGDEEEDEEEEDTVAEELRAKIQEMEGQISKVWNPDLKERLAVVLDGLKAQLRGREGTLGVSDGEDGDGEEGEQDEDEDEDEEDGTEEPDHTSIDALDSDEDEDACSAAESDAQPSKLPSRA
ncbi:hypothetical protein ACJQWK_10238 [Exserohilum turcicum]|uniref:Microbial-type PARG catalytic domain-containing protein n=1 Tax=Exserohilum turcicum (strain 28A) TaxID=671987 RepID=R0KCZ5_EXST2|nr:uncharacterized protein SETTUDRAFT_87333 [Exserohilum turcica Et28A]EOA87239.1 hypothetical protein SETTUDRAFT_87333 [Exserohilum turcica Et28A]